MSIYSPAHAVTNPPRLQRPLALAVGLLLLTTSALPAAAAVGSVSRFGTTYARSCFEAAEAQKPSRTGRGYCDTALSEEPLTLRDRAATLVNRGILKVLDDEFESAQRDYDTAIRMVPELGEAWVDRGLMYVRLSGKEAEAIRDLSKGLELGTREPAVAHYGRALAYEAVGRVREAYEDYQRATQLRPEWNAPKEELARFRVRPAS